MFDDSSEEVLCGYTEEVTTVRFVYISIGGVVASGGCASNLLLLYLFSTKRYPNSPPNLYPAMLAVLDSLLCFFFILIFVLDVNMIYLSNKDLFILYHDYIVVAFAAAKLVQFLIPYLLMLATYERYSWIAHRHQSRCFHRPACRFFSLILILVCAVLIRIPAALSLTISRFDNCPDFFRTLAVDVKTWAKDSEWYTLYDVYGIAFLQTFLPFVILITLNVIIVNRLASIDCKNRNNNKEKKPIVIPRRTVRVLSSLRLHKMPASVRNAVFTMVAIVTSYLISNSLHIFLTLLEVGKASILTEEKDPYKASVLYTTLGDGVSLLYMASSAIRILIYTVCNPMIRRQVLLSITMGKVDLHRKDSVLV